MPKSFISILGTNDYLECRHSYGNFKTEIPVKYCQEDLIKIFCKDFDEESEIRIFLTEDAEKKNWLDNGHVDRKTNQPIPNKGLKTRLEELNLSIKIKPIRIKEGYSESEIWEIFEVIYNSFRKNEEVIVDITHSFRSLPLLMVTLLNFAKQVKNIRVVGIYYAAFENLGSILEARKIPAENRIAPVLDLTSFSELQDWTNATFDFLKNANINLMKSLAKHSLQQTVSEDPISKYFPSKVLDKLEKLINNIAFCRGKELLNFNFSELKNDIGELKRRDLAQAFTILIDEVDNKISKFENDYKNLIIEISEWCLHHRLFQQAITLLQEFTISFFLSELNLQINDETNRILVSQAFRIRSQKIKEKEWKEPAASNKETIRKIIDLELFNELTPSFNKLTKIRNDVNHSGFLVDAASVESIKTKLENIVQQFKDVLGSYYAHQSIQSSK